MKRLIVCDPACVQPFGHNVVALNYFKSAFVDHFDECIAVCCELLAKSSVEAYGFLPFYRFYYARYFPAIADRSSGEALGGAGEFSRYERAATEDAQSLLERLSITAEDAILFPHLDFYGVLGMLNALYHRPSELQPRLLLRFIGVMENAGHGYHDPLRELLSRIGAALEDGASIDISAETPKYADYLAAELRKPVSVTGYPDEHAQLPLRKSGPFVYSCPGSARFDKGFLDLPKLFGAVRRRDPRLKIQFITQLLADHDIRHHTATAREIYALPGVKVLPSIISEAEMMSVYEDSHVILLPYAADIYALRGSAALMEATALGRRVLTYEGTAFAEQVRYYGFGKVVGSFDEMIEAMIELAAQDRDAMEAQAAQARFRYRSDNKASFRDWLKLS